MRDAVICEPLRTPVGGFGGSLRDVPAQELAATVIRALMERTGLPPDVGGRRPARPLLPDDGGARRSAGSPRWTPGCRSPRPGMQIDRRCGSGLQAVLYAAMQVQTGASRRRPRRRRGVDEQRAVLLDRDALGRQGRPGRAAARRPGPRPGHRRRPATTRCPAACSRRRRTCAASTGSPARSRTSTPSAATSARPPRSRRAGSPTRSCRSVIAGRKGETVVDRDEHIRPDTSVETLAGLRPIMGRDDPEATVTAGNASGQNDGAAVCDRHHPEKAAELGLRPLARLVSWGVAGVPPKTMGIGPVPATAKALGAGRPEARRHRPDRAQRGVRQPGARRDPRVGLHRRRLRADQRQRLRHLPRPPGRRDRRAHPRHAAARDGPPRGPLRPGDDVHRRRPGPGRGVRAGLLRLSWPGVAIVTGAARGIGAATALRLAADGFAVAVVDLEGVRRAGHGRGDRGRRRPGARRSAPTSATPTRCRPPSTGSPRSSARRSCWSTTPACTRDNLLFKMTDDDWDIVMRVHLRGAFLMTRAVQKHMVEAQWGRIVNLSSTSALGNRGQANYAAAKAGLQGFTKTLAIELGKFGVTANAIAPGLHRHRHDDGDRRADRRRSWSPTSRPAPPRSRSPGPAYPRTSRTPSRSWSARAPASSPARSSTSPAGHAPDPRAVRTTGRGRGSGRGPGRRRRTRRSRPRCR